MSEHERYQHIIDTFKEKASHSLPKGSRVALYDSRARVDAHPDSDRDLQIMIPGDVK